MADPSRHQSPQPTAMELGTTPPKHTPIMPSTSPSAQLRVLTTSNSFDSKSNIAAFGRYPAEATKLFNTLQQSSLPINQEVISDAFHFDDFHGNNKILLQPRQTDGIRYTNSPLGYNPDQNSPEPASVPVKENLPKFG